MGAGDTGLIEIEALRRHIETILATPKHRVYCVVALDWLTAGPNVRQRHNVDEDEAFETEIEETGLLHNLVVRVQPLDPFGPKPLPYDPLRQGDVLRDVELIVVCGQRRFGALRALGKTTASVVLGVFSDEEALLVGACENQHRVNLRPWEIADVAIKLHEKNRFHWPYTKLADKLGISSTYLSNLVTCAKDLCPRLQKVFRGDQAGYGAASLTDLIRIAGHDKDPVDQERAWDLLMEANEFGPPPEILGRGRGGGRGQRQRKKNAKALRQAAAAVTRTGLPGARLAAAVLAWTSSTAPFESLVQAVKELGSQ